MFNKFKEKLGNFKKVLSKTIDDKAVDIEPVVEPVPEAEEGFEEDIEPIPEEEALETLTEEESYEAEHELSVIFLERINRIHVLELFWIEPFSECFQCNEVKYVRAIAVIYAVDLPFLYCIDRIPPWTVNEWRHSALRYVRCKSIAHPERSRSRPVPSS